MDKVIIQVRVGLSEAHHTYMYNVVVTVSENIHDRHVIPDGEFRESTDDEKMVKTVIDHLVELATVRATEYAAFRSKQSWVNSYYHKVIEVPIP